MTQPATSNPPYYKAIGCVEGFLRQDGDRLLLHVDDHCFAVSGVRHGARKHIPECGATASFLIYPRVCRDGRIKSLYISSVCLKPAKRHQHRQFRAAGVVRYCGENKQQVALRIERNRSVSPDEAYLVWNKPFNLIIDGSLPAEAYKEFWQIEALLVGDRLLLIHAEKLADAPAAKTKKEQCGDRKTERPKLRSREPVSA